MADRYDREIPSFNGVAASSVATVNVPTGPTYHRITLEYKESGTLAIQADMEDAISEIRLVLNGVIVRRLSAAELIKLNALYGRAFNAGYLDIFLGEPWLEDPLSQDILAWGTQDVQSLVIEVVLTSGATSPSLKARAEISLAPRNLGVIKKIRKFTVSVAGTGITNFATLPRGDAYWALHAVSANITDVSVKKESQMVIQNLTPTQLSNQLKGYKFLSPQSGYYHLLFGRTQRITDALSTVVTDATGKVQRVIQDFQLDFNMSSAASFTLIAETIGTLDVNA